MKFKTYFWDFDGTLFDSYPAMTKAYLQAASQFGVKADYMKVFCQLQQGSLGQAAREFCSVYLVPVSEFMAAYKQAEKTRQPEIHPFAGVTDQLKAVVNGGGRNFLLTHRNQAAEEMLARAGLKDLFAGAVTGEMPFKRKPAPDSLNYLCSKYDVDKTTAVMVGDRVLDVEAAKNAGLAGILFDPHGLQPGDYATPVLRIKSFVGAQI